MPFDHSFSLFDLRVLVRESAIHVKIVKFRIYFKNVRGSKSAGTFRKRVYVLPFRGDRESEPLYEFGIRN